MILYAQVLTHAVEELNMTLTKLQLALLPVHSAVLLMQSQTGPQTHLVIYHCIVLKENNPLAKSTGMLTLQILPKITGDQLSPDAEMPSSSALLAPSWLSLLSSENSISLLLKTNNYKK